MDLTPKCISTPHKAIVMTIGVLSLAVSTICSSVLSIALYEVTMVVQNPGTQADAVISKALAQGCQAIIMVLLTLTLVDVIVTVFMIIGIYKNIPRYMFPWVTFRSLCIKSLMGTCPIVITIIVVISPTDVFLLVFFVTGAVCTMIIYFWLVVNSHYKNIIAESKEEDRANDVNVFPETHLRGFDSTILDKCVLNT